VGQAMEQRSADLYFQILDLLAERGLANSNFGCRPREMPFLSDSQKISDVNMTISLAFLAPDLVKAAIEGRLPHGMGVARLADLPVEWPRQYDILGLSA
jgi:hypothetical protein